MVDIVKPETYDLEQIRKILTQWTETEEADKYVTRISNEIGGKTEFNMQFWVARENGKAVGIIGLCNPLPKLLHLAKTHKPGELKILYVDTKNHGKGVGTNLLDFIADEAKKQGYSELLVRSAEKYRETAYGFYEKKGYVKLGVIDCNNCSKTMQVFGKLL
jgi:GNAT superfamily N-acetyltransferase